MRSPNRSIPPGWEPPRKKPGYRLGAVVGNLLLWALLFASIGLVAIAFRWMVGQF